MLSPAAWTPVTYVPSQWQIKVRTWPAAEQTSPRQGADGTQASCQ